MFKGSITALVTPFRDGAVDEKALAGFVDWQIREGTNGLVPCGTTGESPTLSHDEHKRVVEIVVEVAAGRVPVIAGAGSNNTAEAIDLARHAEKAGAQGLLVVAPYYNKPSQEGLYQHFHAIDAAVGIPIIVYNIPPRSVVDISVETMARIKRDCRNVVGVKDATMNLNRPSLERMAIGPEWVLLSGEDGTALGYMAHGGSGCISVTANVAPKLCSEFQGACLRGDYKTALAYQDRLMPLHRALFLEPNPAGPKFALSVLGRMQNELRLPLVGMSSGPRAEVEAAMRHAGLLN
ncbi:4-hydroxy-tetrahydrodipicolinate synthase [Prosthecomicrobium sp. N25]|uniref:4-hydroxy-tetrahydrodipicolinate synthase n=1 Tax=Prosthecomicrobium sp. N25 TaxID=3129254 RepID=UPI00307835D2